MATAARIPMMATTIISSTSVKPALLPRLRIIFRYFPFPLSLTDFHCPLPMFYNAVSMPILAHPNDAGRVGGSSGRRIVDNIDAKPACPYQVHSPKRDCAGREVGREALFRQPMGDDSRPDGRNVSGAFKDPSFEKKNPGRSQGL